MTRRSVWRWQLLELAVLICVAVVWAFLVAALDLPWSVVIVGGLVVGFLTDLLYGEFLE